MLLLVITALMKFAAWWQGVAFGRRELQHTH